MGYGYLVTNTADSFTQGTLRSAVAWANLNAGPERIRDQHRLFDTAGRFCHCSNDHADDGPLDTGADQHHHADRHRLYRDQYRVTISGGSAFQDFYDRFRRHGDLHGPDDFRRLGSGSAGGGIANFGTLTVTQSLITDNTATAGGGIYNDGTLHVIDTTFSGNQAGSGGGLYDVGGLVDCSGQQFFE